MNNGIFLLLGAVEHSPLKLRLQFSQASNDIKDYFLIYVFLQSFNIQYANSPSNQIPNIVSHKLFV